MICSELIFIVYFGFREVLIRTLALPDFRLQVINAVLQVRKHGILVFHLAQQLLYLFNVGGSREFVYALSQRTDAILIVGTPFIISPG